MSQSGASSLALIAMGALVVLNFFTLMSAYPEIFKIDPGCCATRPLAKDFSAFFVGSWRLFHDPANLYTQGVVNDGGPQTSPRPEGYKYLPSLALIVSPLTFVSYQEGIVAFDAIQFLMLPLMAFMVFRLVRSRGLAATILVAVVVLLQPSPVNNWGLSASYYWQWAEGQTKVLEAFFLLSSFYLGWRGNAAASGASFALAAFDPRFVLLAAPLFCFYNRERLRSAAMSAVLFASLTNAGLIIPGVAAGFLRMVVTTGLTTPLYYYGLIPALTVVSLTVLNARDIWRWSVISVKKWQLRVQHPLRI